MNKMLAAVTISISTLLATTFATASPEDDHHEQRSSKTVRDMQKYSYSETRDSREEYGAKRLKQMSWQTGYVMPQHYRGSRYKVESRDYNLPKPNRKQQWYKINNDYVLVDSESNSIIRIVAN